MLSFFPQTPNILFIKFRKLAYIFSVTIIAIGMFTFVKRGEQNFGIDFTGGVLQEFEFKTSVNTRKIREALEKIGLGDSLIQNVKGTARYIIRTYKVEPGKVLKVMKDEFGKDKVMLLRAESVGAMVGKDLRKKAFNAITFALIAMCVYIAIRFKFKFAIAAIIALIHDVLVSIGAMSITQREFSLPVIAALLTIVGYSINDTIVVFDRIRENLKLRKKMKFAELVNISINQTLGRTLLTSLTTLLTVLSLFIFGGEVINPFAFVLLVGIIIGTYSSIFVASPIVVDWTKEK